MSILHNKIHFRNKSNFELGLMVVEFDPIVGATSAFLGMNPVITESFDGSRDSDFGAIFSERVKVNVSFIKKDQYNMSADFTVEEIRAALQWISGSRMVSWLDLYRADGTIDYSILGRFVDVQMQKMDHRVVGIRATFQGTSPWAYSGVQTYSYDVNGTSEITINNKTDDLESYIYPKVIFENTSGRQLTMTNTNANSEVIINNLATNELITMDSNQIIYSDNIAKIYGENFNYQWLHLVPGDNKISVSGTGKLTIQYRYPIKIGDAAVNTIDVLPDCAREV